MSEAAFVELVVLCGTAAGFVLLAIAQAALGGRSTLVRLAATAGSALAAGGLPAAVGLPAAAVLPVAIVAVAGLTTLALSSTRLAATLHRLRNRSLHAAVLAVAGGVVFIGGLSRYDLAEAAETERDMAFMLDVTWKPPLTEVAEVTATTDRGRPIAVHRPSSARPADEVAAAERRVSGSVLAAGGAIRTGPPTDDFNCHGWVFSGGRYWVGPAEVELILADNGYQTVSEPRPGDLVIYREGDRITHTGVVRTAGNGEPVLVESKWGWMGRYLHPPGVTCYGRAFTYYRSPRQGHAVVGFGEAEARPGAGGPGSGY